MSVLNRKMFKPRNARNALNRAAGIPSVAMFHAGGPVGHAHPHPPPGSVFNVATQQIRQPRPETVVSRSGRRFMFPTTSPTLSGATDIGMARTALKGGLGSLNPAEQSYMSAAMGKLAGRNVAAPVKNYLGDSVVGEIAEGASELAGTVGGGVGGLLTGLISDDTGDKTTLAGRVGLMEPSDEYLASLGINPADPDPANLQTASAMGRPFPAGPPKPSMTSPGMFQGPRQAVSPLDMSDPQVRARLEQERRAREITEAGGDVVVDPNTGEVTSSTGQSIEELLKFAQPDPEEGLPVVDTDDQDPVRPKSAADPAEPGPEDPADRDEADNKTAAIVAQARTANAAEGIPPQDSAQSEITTAIESGTDSPAAIKAEFMKLLPKYEEDSSVTQGLNLALMGFTIASGTSSNALENFANGMKKTIPNFIKSAEKRKAFERETDLLASKYAIQRLEGDRTRGFAKNDYYVTEDFDGPNGTKYTAGQYLRLNDKGFSALERGGFTRNLVSGTIYKQLLDDRAEVTKANLARTPKTIDDFYQSTPKTRKINENISVEIYYPKPSAPKGTKPMLAGGADEWNSVTQGYVNDLAAIAETDNAIEDAIKLVDEGALGTPGLIGKLGDAARGATEDTAFQPLLAKAGLDYSKLSAGTELENLNRIIALQSARIILNEGGKMISNQERQMVARSLGFKDATIEAGTDTLNLGSYSNAFTSKKSAIDALRKVQKIVRSKARDSHSGYKKVGSLIGLDLQTLQGAKKAAPGSRLQKRDDGKFYLPGG